jgi:hypothetical protein
METNIDKCCSFSLLPMLTRLADGLELRDALSGTSRGETKTVLLFCN